MDDSPGTLRDPEEIANRMAIEEILNLHSRGLDRLDQASLANAYWPDAEVDYGSFKGPAQQFAEIVVPVLGETYALTRHSLSNILIQVSRSAARSEACVHAAHLLPGRDRELLFYGRYLDRHEKRDGRWKILHRTVVVDWCKSFAIEDERDSEAFSALAKGGHFNNDPLYPFLSAS